MSPPCHYLNSNICVCVNFILITCPDQILSNLEAGYYINDMLCPSNYLLLPPKFKVPPTGKCLTNRIGIYPPVSFIL